MTQTHKSEYKRIYHTHLINKKKSNVDNLPITIYFLCIANESDEVIIRKF